MIRFKEVAFDQISIEQFKLSAKLSNLFAEIYKAMHVLKGKFEIIHVSKKLNNFKALKVNFSVAHVGPSSFCNAFVFQFYKVFF